MKAILPILALAALGTSIGATAQQSPCGLTSMTETTLPYFPPIAKAAHVQGVVVMLAEFAMDGTVKKLEVVSGPELLRQSAVASVKTWHANAYSGPRTCPVAVTFHLYRSETSLPSFSRPDVQHVVINYNSAGDIVQSNYEVAASHR